MMAAAPIGVLRYLAATGDHVVTGDDRSFAIFDSTRAHRLALGRQWHATLPPMVVCMLNPSTADERVVDPTVRKCLHFAQRDGFGGLVVVNLFSIRATDPADLPARLENDEPIDHPMNMLTIGRALGIGREPVAAWGVPKWRFVRERADHVRKLGGGNWMCLGTSKDGHPLHPCYLANATQRRAWP